MCEGYVWLALLLNVASEFITCCMHSEVVSFISKCEAVMNSFACVSAWR